MKTKFKDENLFLALKKLLYYFLCYTIRHQTCAFRLIDGTDGTIIHLVMLDNCRLCISFFDSFFLRLTFVLIEKFNYKVLRLYTPLLYLQYCLTVLQFYIQIGYLSSISIAADLCNNFQAKLQSLLSTYKHQSSSTITVYKKNNNNYQQLLPLQ